MSSAAEQLRAAIDAFHRHWGEAELLWLRRAEQETPWRATADWLLSEGCEEVLGEARKERELDAQAYAAVEAQRALVAFRVSLAAARPMLARIGATKFACGSEGVLPLALVSALLRTGQGEGARLHARALAAATETVVQRACELRDEALCAAQNIVSAPAHLQNTMDSAAKFLDATDDAARELVRWLMRQAVTNGDTRWNTLLFALRRADLDGLAPPGRRFFRLAAGFRRLGFEREMNAHLHLERGEPVLVPFLPGMALRSVPGDVRLGGSALEFGVLSDLHGAAALGGGLALSLVSPALPVEQRWPLDHGVPQALAQLAVQLRADRFYMQRLEGLPERHAEIVARHAAIVVLLSTRACAALELAGFAPARNLDDRAEALGNALTRALCVDVPVGFAALAWLQLPPFAAELRGRLAGLALHTGLRERFDEDWFCNPRVAEPLRGACARGNTLDADGLCGEWGVTFAAAAPRLLELLA